MQIEEVDEDRKEEDESGDQEEQRNDQLSGKGGSGYPLMQQGEEGIVENVLRPSYKAFFNMIRLSRCDIDAQ